MEPSNKNPEIEEFLESIFGRTTSIKENICIICKRDVGDFRDNLSKKEYTISGMCQDCQDDFYGD